MSILKLNNIHLEIQESVDGLVALKIQLNSSFLIAQEQTHELSLLISDTELDQIISNLKLIQEENQQFYLFNELIYHMEVLPENLLMSIIKEEVNISKDNNYLLILTIGLTTQNLATKIQVLELAINSLENQSNPALLYQLYRFICRICMQLSQNEKSNTYFEKLQKLSEAYNYQPELVLFEEISFLAQVSHKLQELKMQEVSLIKNNYLRLYLQFILILSMKKQPNNDHIDKLQSLYAQVMEFRNKSQVNGIIHKQALNMEADLLNEIYRCQMQLLRMDLALNSLNLLKLLQTQPVNKLSLLKIALIDLDYFFNKEMDVEQKKQYCFNLIITVVKDIYVVPMNESKGILTIRCPPYLCFQFEYCVRYFTDLLQIIFGFIQIEDQKDVLAQLAKIMQGLEGLQNYSILSKELLCVLNLSISQANFKCEEYELALKSCQKAYNFAGVDNVMVSVLTYQQICIENDEFGKGVEITELFYQQYEKQVGGNSLLELIESFQE